MPTPFTIERKRKTLKIKQFNLQIASEPYQVGRLTEKGREYLDRWYCFVELEKQKDNPKA